jgi:hypothetical protein
MEIRARRGAEGGYDRNEPLARRGVAPRQPARSQPQGGRVDGGPDVVLSKKLALTPNPKADPIFTP